MSDLSLRVYKEEIERLIEVEAHEEAIVHCQHVLHHYPKHLEIYRLLGKACLEKGDHLQATDLFRRVLSADPEDFLSRVGLGIAYTQDGAIEEAIWHMERAFELMPSNAEIRNELLRLYYERDGVERERLKLTQGALGRLYAQGGLFRQAVAEFKAILERDPKLIDVQMALAEALWRNGQRVEAEQLCLDIVEKLPNCLKANLLLGEIWLHGDREEQGKARLAIAQALDPENVQAQKLFGESTPLLLETIEIPRLKTPLTPAKSVPAVEPEEDDAEAFEWLRQLRAERVEGIELGAEPRPGETKMPEFEGPDGAPDWLPAPGPLEAEEALETEAEGPSDWLKEIGLEMAVPEAEETAPPVAEAQEVPDWLRESLPGQAEEAQGVPDRSQPVEAETWGEPARTEEVEMGPSKEDAGEIPEWLRELQSQAGEESEEAKETPEVPAPEEEAPAPAAEPVEEIPEWLQRLRPEAVEEGEVPELAAEELVEVPISIEDMTPEQQREAGMALWQQILREEGLEELIAEEVPTAEAPPVEEAPVAEVPSPAEPAEGIPEWLQRLRPGAAEEEEAPSAEAPPAAEPAEEAPEWLRRLRPEAAEEEEVPSAEAPPAAEPAEEAPEWLRRLRPEEVEEEVPGPVAEEPVEVPISTEGMRPERQREVGMPLWRQILREEGLEELIAEETPAAEAPPVEEMPVAEVLPPVEPVEGIPEWLRDEEPEVPDAVVEEPEELPPAELAEEIPSWLQQLRAEMPEELLAAPTEEEIPPIPVEFGEISEPIVAEELAAEALPPWLAEIEEITSEEEPAVPEPSEEVEFDAALPVGEIEDEREPAQPVWLREILEEEKPIPEAMEPPLVEEVEMPPSELAEEIAPLAEEVRLEEVAAPPVLEIVEEAVAPEEIEAVSPIAQYEAELSAQPKAHQPRLALARAYVEKGDLDAALEHYEKLIRRSAMLGEVSQDLEVMAEEHADSYVVRCLLGDAYMKGGQLPRALKAYRQAKHIVVGDQ